MNSQVVTNLNILCSNNIEDHDNLQSMVGYF